MIEEFLTRLAAAGLDPDLRELRDALWLAQHVVPIPAAMARPESGAGSKRKPQPDRGDEEQHQAKGPDLPALPSDAAGAGAELHAAGPGAGRMIRAMEARSPAVPALRHQLQLSRALRPVKRRRPSRTSYVIDEDATAAQAAEEGIWFPVFRPALTRWLELELVIDTAPSMAVWRRTSAELKNLLQQLGGFRSIRESFIDSSTGDAAGAGPLTLDRVGRPRDLATPAGIGPRRAILVVTDAVGPAWRSGQMYKVLKAWGASIPTTVVTVLPQRMWPGSGLRAAPGQLRNATGEAASPVMASRARTRLDDPADPPPISVMELSARWLAPWAELLAGSSGWRPAALLQAPDTADSAPTLRRDPAPGDAAADVIRQFRASASPTAFQLACYLSATGLNLPVMRLVQRVMLPQSDTAHLAEVFLSGLLRIMPTGDDTIEEEAVQYDFIPGVRDELNHYLLRDEMLDVVRETSRFVAERFGQPLDFSALLTDPAGAPLPALGGDQAPPLAYVSATVLAKLGGHYQVLARRLAAAAAEHAKAPGRATAASPHAVSTPPKDQGSSRPSSHTTRRSKPTTLRPYFYLSYARTPRTDPTDKGDPNRWIYKLYRDLSEAILQMTDARPEEAGFMDRGNKLGAEWSPEMMTAIANCRVFVPLYSRRYFESNYCGREWFAFARREITKKSRGELVVDAIVPALWTKLDRDRLPLVAQAVQFDHNSLGERYSAEGFYGIMKLRNYRADYQRAVHRLAERIIAIGDEITHFPEEKSIAGMSWADFDSLPSAFGPSSKASAPPPGSQATVATDPANVKPAKPSPGTPSATNDAGPRGIRPLHTYRIRRAVADDTAAILDLIGSAATWLQQTKDTDQWARPWPDQHTRDARVERGILAARTWIVDDGNGAVAATITYGPHANDEIWTANELLQPSVYVSRVIVSRSQAGLGIGAALINWAGQRGAQEWGANWIRLEVWTTNSRLHEYFRNQGFMHLRTLPLADNWEYPEAALFQKPTSEIDYFAASLFIEEETP